MNWYELRASRRAGSSRVAANSNNNQWSDSWPCSCLASKNFKDEEIQTFGIIFIHIVSNSCSMPTHYKIVEYYSRLFSQWGLNLAKFLIHFISSSRIKLNFKTLWWEICNFIVFPSFLIFFLHTVTLFTSSSQYGFVLSCSSSLFLISLILV